MEYYSTIYEDFILYNRGEVDHNREKAIEKARSIINEYLQKNGNFGVIGLRIRYKDAFIKHEQDYVNISYSNTGTKAATSAGNFALRTVPGGGLAAAVVSDIQNDANVNALGRFFHDNERKIQSKLNDEIEGYNVKVSSAGNILEITMREYKQI
jgi:hypothetical protein